MKPLPHRYAVRLDGGPDGHALAAADGLPDLRSAPPVDFDGPGDACEVTTEGTVDRSDGVTRFTEIILRPRLRLAAGTDPDRARRAMEKAERACLVSASLATPIRLEAELA